MRLTRAVGCALVVVLGQLLVQGAPPKPIRRAVFAVWPHSPEAAPARGYCTDNDTLASPFFSGGAQTPVVKTPQQVTETAARQASGWDSSDAVSSSGSFELLLAKPKKAPAATIGESQAEEEASLLKELSFSTELIEEESTGDLVNLDAVGARAGFKGNVGEGGVQLVPGRFNTPKGQLGQAAAPTQAEISTANQAATNTVQAGGTPSFAGAASLAANAQAAIDKSGQPTLQAHSAALNNAQIAAATTTESGAATYDEKNSKEVVSKNSVAERMMQAQLDAAKSTNDAKAAAEASSKLASVRATKEKEEKKIAANTKPGNPPTTGEEHHPQSRAAEMRNKAAHESAERAWKQAVENVKGAEASEIAAKGGVKQEQEGLQSAESKYDETHKMTLAVHGQFKNARETLQALAQKGDQLLTKKSEEAAALSKLAVEAKTKEARIKSASATDKPEMQMAFNEADELVKKSMAKRTKILNDIKVTETAKAAQTVTVGALKKKKDDYDGLAKADQTSVKDAKMDLEDTQEKAAAAAKNVTTQKSMLEFAKMNNLGLKPGVCCQQVNKAENQPCLKCRCSDPKQLQEANAHCTSCKPGEIHLLDVTGVGTCREWETKKELFNDKSEVNTACPLYPYQITKLNTPGEGFACYRWGWFKELLMAAKNGLDSQVYVRPVCKVMKQTVCSKEDASTKHPTKMSRACSVKKSAQCSEVWIESKSFANYFKALDEVLRVAAASATLAAQAAAQSTPKVAAPANATALQQAFQGSGGERRLLQHPVNETEVAAKEAQEALVKEQTNAFVKSKCANIGGTVRTMSKGKTIYCSVGCNPENKVVREMLALQGSKWTTDWRAGNWCEGVAAAL